MFHECLDMLFEAWQVLLHGSPNLIQIHAEVLVNENVAHRHDLSPRQIGMRLVKRFAQLSGSFANDLYVV